MGGLLEIRSSDYRRMAIIKIKRSGIFFFSVIISELELHIIAMGLHLLTAMLDRWAVLPGPRGRLGSSPAGEGLR